MLIKTDPAGNILWQRVYGGLALDYFLGVDELRLDPSGDIVACGTTRSFGPQSQGFYVRVNSATGALVLARRYGAPSAVQLWSIHEISNGELLFSGFVQPGGSPTRGLLMRTLTGGRVRNLANWGGTGWSEFPDACEMPDGTIMTTGLVLGVPGGYGGYDLYVGYHLPNLLRLGSWLAGGPDTDIGYSINPAAPPSDVIVAGLTTRPGEGSQLYLVNAPGPGAYCEGC